MSADDLTFTHRYISPQASGLPTLLMLHGTGGDENDLLSLGKTFVPGAGLLSPRGKVSEHGAARFFRRLDEGVFDIPDLKLRTGELAEFVRQAAKTYGFDAGNVIAVGYSNGANIAASLLLLAPDVLRGAILFRSMLPFEPETLPDLTGKQVLMAAGRLDPLVAADQVEELAAILKRAGAEVELRWQEGDHGLTMDDVGAATAWLAGHELVPAR